MGGVTPGTAAPETQTKPRGREPRPKRPGATKLARAVIVDFDGTLALNRGTRRPFDWDRVFEDTPNWPIIELVRLLSKQHAILVVSGRDEQCRAQSSRWLAVHDVPFAHLLMRPHRDNRQDAVVKAEIYHQTIRPHWDVAWVLDDRNQTVQMWRDLGLTCLQVAPGDF